MDAVSEMAEEEVIVQGASRTDAGVHALGQCAGFTVSKDTISADGWRKGLNALLPSDIAVRSCDVPPPDWDPRRSATAKRYRYNLLNRRVRSPLHDRTSWWRRGHLDVEAMQEAGAHLLGENDFTSFRSARCSSKTPWRRMYGIEVRRVDELVLVDVHGNAFLQHMVRSIVGTLVAVGHGRTHPDELADILAAKDRQRAGRTAPACGLTLVAVSYE